MAKYRKIDTRMWRDEKFLSLDEGSQWLFMHLLTSPYTSMIGTLAMTPGMLSEFLRKRSETVSERLRNLSEKGLVVVDNHGLIWIRNFLKYNPPSNPNMAKGFLDVLDDLPECELQKVVSKQAIEVCTDNGFCEVAETITKRFRNRLETVSELSRNKEQEQEQDQEQKNTTTTSLSAANAELQEVASEEAESEIPPLEPELEPEPPNSNLKIPYGEIVELYNRMCVPGCVEVRILNPSRKTLIKQRANDMMKHWDGHGKNDLIECFTRLFTHVKNSDFLMGKTAKHGNHANWQCTFSWILKSENFVNILEGKYE